MDTDASTLTVNDFGRNAFAMIRRYLALLPLVAAVGLGLLVPIVAGPANVASATTPAEGYWLVGSDGGVFTFGNAQFYGSAAGVPLQRPIVGMAATPDRLGYWLVASDGGVFSYGDARYHGSIPALGIAPAGSSAGTPQLTAPIVGIVSSADGGGYFLIGADGGVFAFGDAHFAGSCYGETGTDECDAPIAAAAGSGAGGGYWLMSRIGTSYNFGGAPPGCQVPPQQTPVTSLSATPNGSTYAFVFASGYVIGCTTPLYGTRLIQLPSGETAVGLAVRLPPATAQYWVATNWGAVLAPGIGGLTPSLGTMAGKRLDAPVVGIVGW